MPFVPGILVEGGKTLYVAGATALPLYHKHPHDPKELEIPEDIKEQTRRVLENIRTVVESAGAKMENIVSIKKYLTRMEDQDKISEVLTEYFGENLPTSTTIEVKSLVVKDARLEIDAIAVF
jgi:2-iminobutanoate/2-iminopropanoate deaminase